jgi:hypothetical protein
LVSLLILNWKKWFSNGENENQYLTALV